MGLLLAAALMAFVAAGCGSDRLPLPLLSPDREPVTMYGSADLRVLPPAAVRLASVSVAPSELHVPQGAQAIFTASARDETGRVLSRVAFDWNIIDARAGSVSSNGVFTAGDTPGVYEDAIIVEARQEAGDEVFTADQFVTVVVHTGRVDHTLGRVVVSPSTVQGRPGDRVPLQAIAIGAGGGLVHGVELSWNVLDGRAGTVDENGVFTLGEEPGRYEEAVEVEARPAGGEGPAVRARATVHVFSPAEVAREITALISPGVAAGRPDDVVPLSFFAFDSRGRSVPVREVRWSMTNPNAGAVDAAGRVTLGSGGGAYPGAVEAAGVLDGDFTGERVRVTADVSVEERDERPPDVAPTSPEIVPRTLRLKEGDRERLHFVYPNAGDAGAARVEWTATTDAVSVDHRGRVTAVGPPGNYRGAVRAEARLDDGTVYRAEATVVVLGPLHRVEVTPASLETEPGQLTQFTAIAYDAGGNRLTDVRFTWELAPGTPGTMTASGLYAAGDESGTFPSAIRVRAAQR